MQNLKKILKFEIFSIIFVSILGTLLHFTFDWSNSNLLVGTFSAVNESTWEHLKLLFFPMLISTIIGYFYVGKDVSAFLCARFFAIFISILFTVVFFYTYTGILGFNVDILNILSFFVSVILGEFVSYKIMISHLTCDNSKVIIFFAILLVCFIFFTYLPPNIGLFKDPITNSYGISL